MTKLETAVFGGGCFWCAEAVFERLLGVKGVIPGYAGGQMHNPSYEDVSTGQTGYAEVIKIDYDPSVITFEDLLSVFFSTHDPTTLNRQGADVGSQYRSVIFYTAGEQRDEAWRYIQKLEAEKIVAEPVVTQIKPLDKFYPAEEYHMNYYNQNPDKPYCQAVINPKLEKLKKQYARLYKN